MDIQAQKINLAQKILQSNDPELLKKLEEIFLAEEKKDWFDELPLEIQESITQGLSEMESGELITHEQLVQEAKAKYGF